MSDDELLASVMRKLIRQSCVGGLAGYLEVMDTAAIFDSWVENLTAEEAAVLRRLQAEARAEEEAAWERRRAADTIGGVLD